MNFARAVQGRLTRSSIFEAIQSQAETELGRMISKEEQNRIFAENTPSAVLDKIQKVIFAF